MDGPKLGRWKAGLKQDGGRAGGRKWRAGGRKGRAK